MKWKVVIIGSLAIEHVRDVSAEFVRHLESEYGAKITSAEVIAEKNEESINLLHGRDVAAQHFVSKKDNGLGYDAPPAPAEEKPSIATIEAAVDRGADVSIGTDGKVNIEEKSQPLPPDDPGPQPSEPTPEPTPESAAPAAVNTEPSTNEA